MEKQEKWYRSTSMYGHKYNYKVLLATHDSSSDISISVYREEHDTEEGYIWDSTYFISIDNDFARKYMMENAPIDFINVYVEHVKKSIE